MRNKPIPFFDGSARQWKAMKRKELQAILRAFDTFRLGCAYTPIYPSPVETVDSLLDEMKRKLSVKHWGR